MAKIDLNTVSSGYLSQAALNANFTAIEDEFQNKVLYRDNPNGEPNSMQNNLDMNGFHILNAGNINPVDADSISYTPDGTGAETRTIAEKLNEVVSVKDFGAVGNGVTDDTVAFQAAADIGGQIFVPNGIYIVDYVVCTTNVTWVGEGIKSHIRKKPNSVSQSYIKEAYLFSPATANLTISFENLLLDGNYTAQEMTRTSALTANHSSVQSNAPDGTAAVMGVGGWFSSVGITPVSASDRLVVRFTNCKLYRAMTIGVFLDSQPDIGAYAELIFQGNECYQSGPSIIEYHDGVSLYDGILYPASGYSWSSSGVTAAFIQATDGAHLNVVNNSFIDTRNPLSGGATTGYDWNVYNLPAVAINQTLLSGTTDPTPEWGSITVSSNYFEGLGRTYTTGNGIGVVEMYARGGPGSISNNTFRNCWESPIRGKTNALALAITGNVIDTVYNGGLGINISSNTYASQKGNYSIVGNSIRSAGSGIQVIGNNAPPENSDPSIPDDPNSAVDNVVIADNTIEDIFNTVLTNPTLAAGLSVYGVGIQVRYASSVTITGNVIKNLTGASAAQTEHGIWVRNCIDDLVVSNNVIKTVPRIGVYVQSHTGNAAISGNTVMGAGAQGINMNVTGKVTVIGNVVESTASTGILAASSVGESTIVSGNIVRNVSGNSASNLYGIDSGAMTNGEYTLVNNIIESIANSGAGSAFGARIQYGSVSDANSFVMTGNTIQSTEESGVFLSNINGVISNNYFKSVNTSGVTSQGAIFINGTSQIGFVQITGNRVGSTTAPFPTTGGASGDSMRNNGKISEVGNSWQAWQITRSAIPTAGTWKVGDIVWNSAPTAGGNIGWICTTAGTPGTWTPFGFADISGSTTYDPPSLTAGNGVTTTLSVTGAALGDYVSASFSLDLQSIQLTAWVSATNTVSVRFQNQTAGPIDLASGTLCVTVTKP